MTKPCRSAQTPHQEPKESGATIRWREMVEAEHAQSDRMRQELPPEDHWQPYAQQFRADPSRADDPLLTRLLERVGSHHTVMDVGAGGGRLALPLALRCNHVVAVEPSPSMGSVLLEQARDYGIQNVSLVPARWEEAEAGEADIVLCAHVLYVVHDVEPFLRKLEAHARERVIVVMYDAAPQSQTYSLWKLIHGEERLPLPSLPQLEEVLQELGIDAHVEKMSPHPPRGFDSLQQAKEQLSQRLFLAPGSQEEATLDKALPELLEEVDGVFLIRDARPLAPALVSWGKKPES